MARDANSETNRPLVQAIKANPGASSREVAKIAEVRYTKSVGVAVCNLRMAIRESAVLVDELVQAR